MKKNLLILGFVALVISACQQQPKQAAAEETKVEAPKEKYELFGYPSKEAWGAHLVTITGCDDCHSPKKMTDHGPVPDPALRLSGHPASEPAANVDRQAIEKNGYAACSSSFTSWVGPWGISYAANLTSDASGIGNWTEEEFFRALREGKYKGQENGRMLLPPMPWPNFSKMTDDELSAIFAYLKTVPPVRNIVPAPQPPTTAMVN